jgi:anti-sigma factor RsiW
MNASGDVCAWTQDRIDPFVDGELDGEDLAAFEDHLEGCDSCRRELELATAVVGELRSLPALPCPNRVVDEAAARVGADAAGRGRAWRERLRDLLAAKPVFVPRPAMAAVLIVIVAATVFVLSQHEQSPFNGGGEVTMTEQEAELAKLDVMLAFAYLGKYSRKTGEIITKDVIGERVMKPVGRSVIDPMYPFPREQ